MEWLPLLFSGVSNIVGGWMGNNAANQSTHEVTTAINNGIKFDKETLDKIIALNKGTTTAIGKNLAPWMTAGKEALTAYQGELGLGPENFTSGFKETDAYKFAKSEGQDAVVANMRALGMGGSGAAMKALDKYGTGQADQTYQQYLDRLAGVSSEGLAASTNFGNAMLTGTNNVTDATVNTGRNISDNITSLGVAQGAGTVAGSNSWTNALKNFSGDLGKTLGSYGSDWGKILGGAAT
jgi:hypothetical protein